MKFSPDGWHLLGGVGDGRIYLDGDVPAELASFHAGNWDWLSNDEIAGPGAPDTTTPWSLWAFHIHTRVLRVLDPRSSSFFSASGSGRWGVFLASSPAVSFDAVQSWTDRVMFGMSTEGDEVFTNFSHIGLTLRDRNGVETVVPNAGVIFNVCMRQGVVMWCGVPLDLHAFGAPDPQSPVSGGAAAVFTTLPDGRRMIAQWDAGIGQLVVYEWRARTSAPLMGFALSGDGFDFDHDIALRADGTLVVGTGLNQGETGQRLYELNLEMSEFRVNGGVWKPLVLTNLDSVPLVVPTFDKIDHGCYVAPFFPDKNCPGNACILANDQDYRTDAPATSALILSPTALVVATPPKERFLGIYNETRSGLTISLAELYSVPLFVCQDSGAIYSHATLSQMRPQDVPLLECYLAPNETVQQAFDRWQANLQDLLAAWQGTVGVVWEDYMQAWTVPVARLLEAHAFLMRLVNLSPRVQFVAPFAWNRSDGCVGNPWISPSGIAYYPSPELAECVRRMAAASPGIPEEMAVQIPQVVVDSFTLDELKNGREFVGHDPQNPQLGTKCRVWVENGSAYMEIAYPALGAGFAGRTGKARPVK